jgi:hypothetical protein
MKRCTGRSLREEACLRQEHHLVLLSSSSLNPVLLGFNGSSLPWCNLSSHWATCDQFNLQSISPPQRLGAGMKTLILPWSLGWPAPILKLSRGCQPPSQLIHLPKRLTLPEKDTVCFRDSRGLGDLYQEIGSKTKCVFTTSLLKTRLTWLLIGQFLLLVFGGFDKYP